MTPSSEKRKISYMNSLSPFSFENLNYRARKIAHDDGMLASMSCKVRDYGFKSEEFPFPWEVYVHLKKAETI